MLSAETAKLVNAHFKADQEKVRAELTCKKAAKKRQIEAIQDRRAGHRTNWNNGYGGFSEKAKKRALAVEQEAAREAKKPKG